MSLPPPQADSYVLVTGASSGTGRELARALAARGYDLAVVARRTDRLDQLAAELRSDHGVRVDVRSCDLADAAARASLIRAVVRDGRFVAGLCNAAGLGTYGRVQDGEIDRELQQVRVNVDAVFELTAAVLPEMVARRAGAILNVGSLAGFQPLPRNATYAATKAFVNSVSQGFHNDLLGTGVSCTVLCPGPVDTEFFTAANVPTLAGAGPRFVWSSPTEMAQAGITAMLDGKRIVIPRRSWTLAAVGSGVVPRLVLLPAIALVLGRMVGARPRRVVR
jgi:short-subunit dehydrogenase